MTLPFWKSVRAFHSLKMTTVMLGVCLLGLSSVPAVQAQSKTQQISHRKTPLVSAVAHARPAVVNLRGQKTLRNNKSNASTQTQAVRQVNGMGTGVIIDPSGFILTNFHVVEDVKRIQVTLSDGSTTTGNLIAHDGKTDLALIKIKTDKPLPTIPLGTSTDVMLAETVAALGNAYGYEDTVTRGIISEIGRTVQVSDSQVYYNLLQTDAPINPGNSGGPLINLDGEMIGINVAVRVGAQGIAFAIPVNDAMEVAAGFLTEITERQVSHGIIAKTVYKDDVPGTMVQAVLDFSVSEEAGLRYGDLIRKIDGQVCDRSLDLQRGFIHKKAGDTIKLDIERDGMPRQISFKLGNSQPGGSQVWTQFGAKFTPAEDAELSEIHPDYSKGLRVQQVRPGSPAEVEGLQAGDVLVAMNGWKTETLENMLYILNQDTVKQGNEVVFYIIRGDAPFIGNIRIAATN